MKTSALFSLLFLTASLLPAPVPSRADEIQVAVASNFSDAARVLVKRFETNTGHSVTLSFGSTGKQYAQIKNGAPFHAFFAADVLRPALLEKEGIAISNSRVTYAIGKLVLWSPTPELVDPNGHVLESDKFRFLAMANPRLAPYGKAAQDVLQTRNLWDRLHQYIVRGENIAQTFQFVKSGNATMGFVAYSQIKHPNEPVEGSVWDIPQTLYSPIEQQAILLKDSAAARAFLAFVQSEEALDIIHSYGYDTPNAH
jgi:molybdate transport system substrate-binding protein